MKKRVLAMVLSLVMIMGLLPTVAFAEEEKQRTTTLDLTAQETVDNLTTEGWKWDQQSLTLTLAGLDISVSTGNAITVPDGTTIVLAAGSVNTIETTADSSSRPYGIFTKGALTIKSADPDNKGALNITSSSRGIGHQSNLTENKNFSLSISDIKLYTNAVVGINMRPTNSGYDSNLTVSMSGVDYTYECSTIFQMVTDVGESCLNLIGSNIDGTGNGIVLISGSSTADMTVNRSTLTAKGYIYVGNNKALSAVLNIQDNSIVTVDSEIRIAPKVAADSNGTLSVAESNLSVKSGLYVGGGYANTSVATVTDGSTVNVVGDVSIGSRDTDAIKTNSKSELTVSGSTLTTESNLYVQRGEVSTITVKDGSSVTSKGYVMVGTNTMDVEKAELTVSDSSLTAGMGDMAESIVVGNTGAKVSTATITNSTVIAVSESKGGIQLYPKTGNTGSFVASGSTFFVASKNGGSEIPTEGNHVTTVQFAETAERDADGNLILPAGTTITSGGVTYTVAAGNQPAITYDDTGSMQIPAGTTLTLQDDISVVSDGKLTFEPGQAPQVEPGHTITFTVDGSSYTIDAIDNQTYTGVALEPVVVVKKNDVEMPESIVIEYENNVDIGIATVIIKDNDKKVLSTVFKILPKNISSAEITLGEALTYNGTEQTQTITGVVIDGLDVTYKDLTGNVQTNAGEYELKVTGTGNFTGTAKKTWNIAKATFAVQATGYEGTYDEQPHSITVTAEGATITYSTDGVNYSATNPTFIDAGTYTVYYKAVKANHHDVLGFETVNIAGATFTATFNANNGTLEGENSKIVTMDKKVGELPTATRTGYTFAGWYTADDVQIIKETVWSIAEDTTLYAHWTINQYTITFDTKGGTAVAPITQDYNTAIIAPANSTKTGYTFAGWEPNIPETMPAENMTITAQWKANTYNDETNPNTGADVPQTGDNSHMALWFGLMLVSVCSLVVLLLAGKKRRSAR